MHDRARRPGNTTRTTENQRQQNYIKSGQLRATGLSSSQGNQGNRMGASRGDGDLDLAWIRQFFSFDKILRVDVGALGIFD